MNKYFFISTKLLHLIYINQLEIKDILNINESIINKLLLLSSINFLGYLILLLWISLLISLYFYCIYNKNVIKLYNMNKIKHSKIIKSIERNLNKFDDIAEKVSNIKFNPMKELNLLYIIKSNFKLLIIQLKLHLLRIYINRSLNRILIDVEVKKLIKSEILKVPGDTFLEFLKLHNEIIAELNTISQIEENFFEDLNE